MAFLRLIRASRRSLGWALFAGFLGFLGWQLYVVVQPQPLWTVRGDLGLDRFLPDGRGLVVVETRESGPVLVVRDSVSGHDRHVFPFDRGRRDGGCRQGDGALSRVFGSKDGRFCLLDLGGEEVPIADLFNGQIHIPNSGRPVFAGPAGFSPEGDLVVLYGEGPVFILETATGRIVDQFSDNGVDVVGWTPRHLLLALTEKNETALWDRQTGRIMATARIPGCPWRASPSGDLLVLRGPPNDELAHPVVLWDISESRARAVLSAFGPDRIAGGPFPEVSPDAQFSPDGKILAFQKIDETPILEFWDTATGRRLSRVEVASRAMEFVPDGSALLLTLEDRIEMREVPSGRLLWNHARDSIPIGIGPDSRWAALWDSHVTVRDVRTGEPRFSVPLRIGNDHGQSGPFAWATAVKKEKRLLGPIEDLLKDWVPHGLISEEKDTGAVLVLDMQQGSLHAHIENFSASRAAVSSDGRFLATYTVGPKEKIIRCWKLPLRKPWAWIIGLPTALGLVVVAWRVYRNRQTSRFAAHPQNAPS